MRIPAADLSHSYYTEGALVLGLQPILAPKCSKVEAAAKPSKSQGSVSEYYKLTQYLPFLLLKP